MRRALLLLPLAGCVAGRTAPLEREVPYAAWVPPTRPAPAPRGETEPTREAAPVEEPALPIDLPTALRFAGAENLAIALARERAQESRQRAREAEYGFLPVLRPRVSFFRHEGLTQGTLGEFVDVDKQNAFLGSGADLTLDFGGALFRALAARRRARAEAFGAESAAASTFLEVVERHLDLLAARDAVRIETDALAQARGLLEVEEARRRLGAGLEVDLMRARANLAEAEGRLAEARAATRSASASLVRTLHLDPTTVLVPAEEEIAVLDRFPPDASLESLLGRAFERRPEVAQASARLDAAESEETGAALGPLVPRLRLGASYGGFGETLGGLEGQEGYLAALEWDLGAALFPSKEAASSRVRQARLGLASLKDSVAAEVVRALEESRAARERIRAGEERVRASEETLRLAEARRREGAGLLLEVLDAQAVLTRARTERVRAIADFDRAQFRLLRATGGLPDEN